MLESRSDLFSFIGEADAICITTNGMISKKGEAIMGKGCALEAKKRWSMIPLELAYQIRKNGNKPAVLHEEQGTKVISFPVKYDWKQNALLDLIEESAWALKKMTTDNNFSKVILPRPGCGAGGLEWRTVKPILQKILDNRFTVVSQ